MNYEIPYKSEIHNKILEAVLQRYRHSQRQQQKYHVAWDDAERLCRAYLPESTFDQMRRVARRNSGTQSYRTIEVPYSYAVMLAAHTYLSTVFLARSPIFQYIGRHGEPDVNVQAIESVIDYQISVGEGLVPLYLWILDALKYGCGVLGLYWEDEIVTVSQIEEEQEEFFGIPIDGKRKKVLRTKQARGYVGNKVYNVRPHDFFWDPRVPVYRLQEGGFCGRLVQVGWNDILRGEASGQYFNVDVLRRHRRAVQERISGSPVSDIPEETAAQYVDHLDTGFVTLLEFYIELSPKEWGLSQSSAPEKWVFVVADNAVVIGARPYGAWHNRFPFFVLEPEFEAYATMKHGLIEQTKDLNYTLSWLFNAHFFNVRQAMNNQLVVDPSRVELSDLQNSGGGFLLRLKPAAYGTDPRLAVYQLPVQDVTSGHLANAQVVSEMIQRVTGVSENIMGMLNPRGRKTATEVRASSTFGINRLKTLAEYMSAMGFARLSQVMVQMTQQYHDFERSYRVAGKTSEGVQYLNVGPESIAGFYDFVPVDGTMPVDRYAQATLWTEVMKQLQSNPQLASQYDFGKIFSHIATLMGVRSLDMFRVRVRPDEELAQGVENGNTVPVEQAASAVRGEDSFGRPEDVIRLAGMGPVG